jgi:hypothetical protein
MNCDIVVCIDVQKKMVSLPITVLEDGTYCLTHAHNRHSNKLDFIQKKFCEKRNVDQSSGNKTTDAGDF